MSVDPGGAFVQITIGQVYSEVTGMRQEVRDLTHSVQGAVGQLGDHEVRIRTIEHDGATKLELDKLENDHGPRIQALERWRWGIGGLVAAVSMGGSALIAWLAKIH